jgi:hypothetical protein
MDKMRNQTNITQGENHVFEKVLRPPANGNANGLHRLHAIVQSDRALAMTIGTGRPSMLSIIATASSSTFSNHQVIQEEITNGTTQF